MLRSRPGGARPPEGSGDPPGEDPAGLRTRPLGRADQATVLALLDAHPVRDVLLASRILHDGALTAFGPTAFWGAFDRRGELRGVLHLGPNLVPAVDDPAACDALATVAADQPVVRMVVGEREAVERLWSLVGSSYPTPRAVRARQFVYALQPGWLVRQAGGRGRARLATRGDEERVLRLSAAMYTEEMGENPMARDPDGYRRRVRVLTARGWTSVYEVDGDLQFKMDVGCASRLSAQVQGVYVPPELRGRGVGTRAMASCCALVLDRHPSLSLYVNDFNRPAVALYERIGFRREPYDFQTIMLP